MASHLPSSSTLFSLTAVISFPTTSLPPLPTRQIASHIHLHAAPPSYTPSLDSSLSFFFFSVIICCLPKYCICLGDMQNECQRLATLSEEPIPVETDRKRQSLLRRSWWRWLNARCRQTIPALFHKESKLKLLLAVLGCPLSPIAPPHHPPPGVS